jgi:transposase
MRYGERRPGACCSTTPSHSARRPGSPDYAYYDQAAARLGGNRACLAVARKLLKRSYHTLRELGDEALAPVV